MSTVKFSELNAGTPAGADIIPFVPSGGTSAKKVTFTALAGAILGLNGGTVTADAPMLNLAQTWNNGAVVFTALKCSVTDSASGAGSLLMNLSNSNGSYSRFDRLGCLATYDATGINPDGKVLMTLGATGYTMFQIGTGTGLNAYVNGGGSFAFQFSGTGRINGVNGTKVFALPSSGMFGWLASTIAGETVDLMLWRDAANVLAQRNGTTLQTFRLYSSYTDASNYARLEFISSGYYSDGAIIGAFNAGTGTAQNLYLQPGTAKEIILLSGAAGKLLHVGSSAFYPDGDNSIDLGKTAQRFASGYFGGSVTAAVDFLTTSGAYCIGDANSRMESYGGAHNFLWKVNNTYVAQMTATDLRFVSTGGLCWTDGNPYSGTVDTRLTRAAGNIVKVDNGSGTIGTFYGKMKLDNAYAAGAVTPTGTLTLYDSSGTAYRVPCLV